jgi:MFS transporter, DHA2 family, multidrug resistance protein
VRDGMLPTNAPMLSDPRGPFSGTVLQMIDAEINRQAAMIAYIDAFWLMSVLCLCCLPLVLLGKKPSAPAGAAPPVSE